jgi:hypothetical protein
MGQICFLVSRDINEGITSRARVEALLQGTRDIKLHVIR